MFPSDPTAVKLLLEIFATLADQLGLTPESGSAIGEWQYDLLGEWRYSRGERRVLICYAKNYHRLYAATFRPDATNPTFIPIWSSSTGYVNEGHLETILAALRR